MPRSSSTLSAARTGERDTPNCATSSCSVTWYPRSQFCCVATRRMSRTSCARRGASCASRLSLARPLPVLASLIPSVAAAISVVQYLIQEALGPLAAGAAEELRGGRVVDHPAGLHEHDPVGHAAGERHLVRDNHACHAV